MSAFKPTKRHAIAAIGAWFTLTWSWILFTDSLDLAGSKTQGLLIALIVLIVNVSLSVMIMWNALRVVRWVFRRYRFRQAIVIGIFLLALADFLISWLTALIWIGPQGSVDSTLPLGSPSLLVMNTPLGFAARFLGFYGIAGFIWLTVFMLWFRRYRTHALIPLAGLLVVATVGCILYSTPNGSTVKATVVAESLDERLAPIDPASSDIVILPEYGLDEISNENLGNRIRMNDPLNPKKHFFIGSAQIRSLGNTGHYNQLIFGNTVDGITRQQNKHRLIPGGEDLSYTVRQGLRISQQQATLDYFTYIKETTKGQHPLEPFTLNQTTVVGAAVCSSIIAPQDYRQLSRKGATILSNSASLTIFKGSSVFSWQQKSLARFMAVANARYFLQSANSAPAYVLDNNGNTLTEITSNNGATVRVRNNTVKTFYTLVGEWTIYVGIVAAGWLLYGYLRPRPTKKKPPKR